MAAPTYKDLMAMIGNLLVAWGQTETSLGDALATLPTYKADWERATFGKRIDMWRDALLGISTNPELANVLQQQTARLTEIRRLRNSVCHHLSRASAATEDGPEPFIVILAGCQERAIPHSELERAVDDLALSREKFHGLIEIARAYPQ